MRTSRTAAFLFGIGLVLASASAVDAAPKFRSTSEALAQGVSAYRSGYYEIAVPALEEAAKADTFLAKYYLARIYSDNSGTRTDHAKAYRLFQEIADKHADVDPDDDSRAPYVAKSLTAVAGYLRTGLREIGLEADPDRATEILRHSALFFNDEDAQFELAKLQLRGEGVQADVSNAKHWLARLSQRGHAGAQAFLADLLWRGKYMPADKVRALVLINVSVANAPSQDRVWIEDIFQNIFCGAGEGIRQQATGMVADWSSRYGRKPESRIDRSGLGILDVEPARQCANGETVKLLEAAQSIAAEPGPASDNAASPPAAPEVKPQQFLHGQMDGGLRDVGAGSSDVNVGNSFAPN
jgi:hypothetical protein